jgi:hypothetical protein
LKLAGPAFQKDHNKQAVLIIDNCNKLADSGEEGKKILIDLQDFAKDWCETGGIRIIFVASEGSVPAILQCKSIF